jgi:hypothetical protein
MVFGAAGMARGIQHRFLSRRPGNAADHGFDVLAMVPAAQADASIVPLYDNRKSAAKPLIVFFLSDG